MLALQSDSETVTLPKRSSTQDIHEHRVVWQPNDQTLCRVISTGVTGTVANGDLLSDAVAKVLSNRPRKINNPFIS